MAIMESTWSWIKLISGLKITATPGLHHAGSCACEKNTQNKTSRKRKHVGEDGRK
jgi:hypothetical protein